MTKRLYVGNLTFDATESNLRDLFAASGVVSDCKIMTDRDTGQPRGFAFVEMSSEKEANDAIESLDGREYGGRNLRVNQAHDRSNPGGSRQHRSGPSW